MAFNQKNPPWQRNAGHQNISNMQAIVSFPQAQPVYNPNIGLQQQQNISILPQIGIQQQQTLYSQTVQYPTSRPINALNFQNQSQSSPTQQSISQNASKFNPSNRVFSGTGVVTKLQNEFGFIDHEVFFHKNICVKGIIPKVGDRVLVDAAYNTNMPFKWNASRVQVLQNSNANSSSVAHSSSPHVRSHGSIYNNVPPSASESRSSNVRNRYSSPARKSPDRHLHRSSNSRSKDEYDESDRRRKREDRDSDRTMFRDKHRERSTDRGRERERSPIRKQSPKRRRVRSVPRYMVQVPKHLLTIKNADVLELRRRYSNLYIPSDFIISDIRWTEAFAPEAPFSIRSPCQFHVMHKDVEQPQEPMGTGSVSESILDPPDADYLYSVKVMMMCTPPMMEFYEKCLPKGGGEGGRHDEERESMHPTRLISFLVGMRGKNETMAIGGAWSPSLDGPNPHTDSTVLIRTAVRTCRALTGIDLSSCSQWYRFVELYYRRSESYHKGRLIPPRIETVVIFLPDVRSCLPTRLEWEQLRLSYKASLNRIINCSSSNSNVEDAAANVGTSSVVAQVTSSSRCTDTVTNSSTTSSAVASSSIAAASVPENVAEPSVVALEQPESSLAVAVASVDVAPLQAEGAVVIADDASASSPSTESATVAVSEEKESNVPATRSGSSNNATGGTPAAAAVSIMDNADLTMNDATTDLLQEYKKMKVAELKAELSSRNLPTDGVKAVLFSRLSDAVMKEKQEVHEKALQDQMSKEAQQEPEGVLTAPTENMEEGTENLALSTDEVMDEPSQQTDIVEVKDEKENAVEVKRNDEETSVTTEVAGENSDVTVKSESKPTSVTRKIEEPVKLSEKEKHLLERRYQLPEKPHLIVHPSRVAKSGKFDCSIISLSVLLDYRPEDTKEHSFEVALFAELFNEMLTRDFGFNIYRALYMLPQAKKESEDLKKESGTDSAAKGSADTNSNGEDGGTLSEKSEELKKKSQVDDKEQRERKRARYSENADDERRSKDKDSGKVLTVNSDLLLSFVYFDVTHCGYMVEKDVEDLIYTLGLNLSRSQIRKIVSKATVRDTLHYRKITDSMVALPAPTQSDESTMHDGAPDADVNVCKEEPAGSVDNLTVRSEKEIEKVQDARALRAVSATMENKLTDLNLNDHENLVAARGNTDYKQQLEMCLQQIVNEKSKQAGSPAERSSNASAGGFTNQTGIVEYNGCVVDIGKLLDQVKRSELAREEAEKLLASLQTQNEKLLSSNTRSTNKIKDLQSETKTLSRQLSDAMRASRDAQQTQTEYFTVIQQVYERVRPIVHKPSRDGSSKRESSKEKSSRVTTSKSKEPSKETGRKEEEKSAKEKAEPTRAETQAEDIACGAAEEAKIVVQEAEGKAPETNVASATSNIETSATANSAFDCEQTS